MAQLNSLIVTGPSRFLNKLMATEIQATQLNVADKLSVTSSVFTYNGRKVMTGSSVGNSTTPVYIDANGYPVAISSYGGTVAVANKLGTATVGSGTKFIYLNGGTATASSSTVGASNKGVYLNSGTVTAMTYALNATINAGAANKLAYYSGANAISQYTSTIGTATKGVYMNAGWPTAMTYELKATLNNATQWGVAYYSTATNVTSTAAGTAGYLLQSNGAAAPSWIQATSANTANTIVKRDGSGNFSAGTITASLNGNASSATKLQTARTINGTSFDGTANITTANWGTARNISIASSDGTGVGTAVSVNGGANVTLKLPSVIKVGNLNAITATTSSTENLTPDVTAIAASPYARDLWHDHFAFLASGHTIMDHKTTADGTTWTNVEDNDIKKLFMQKELSGYLILTKEITARTFTIYTASLGYSSIAWFELGVSYTNPFSAFNILIESSEDKTTWTTIHDSVITGRSAPKFLKNNSIGGNRYVRFTFTKTTNLTTGSASLTCIKAFTTRKGDQGLGIEYEYPYDWDYNRNIYPHSDNTRSLGLSNRRWKEVHATTFHGNASSANKVNNALTINGKTYNGSAAVNVGTIGTAYGGTGVTTHTTNRLVWSTSATTIQAGNHYAAADKIAINSTSAPSDNFYVNGTSHFNGDTRISGNILMSNSNSAIYWDNSTYRQRIVNTDDATADTAVFTFQQSSDSGSNWSTLLTIRDNGKLIVPHDIIANKSIRNLEIGGGIYWNPYVESASDNSDSASITVIKSGCAGGTELRISQMNDSNDVINLVTNKYIYLNGKKAFSIQDNWLRINDEKGFSTGIYTGSSLVRSDSQFQVGNNGANFYANSSGNGYFSNTLGIAGTNTGYKLYVNGTSYFTNYLQTTSYFKSTVATGTAPVQVTSTTLNTNLNADLLDGWHKQDILGTYYVTSGTADLSHYWCKIWNATIANYQGNDMGITIYAQNHFSEQYGLFSWRIRQNGTNNGGSYNFAITLVEHFGNISNTDIRLYYNNSTGICEVWVNCIGQWGVWNYTVLKKCWRATQDSTSIGTFYNNNFTTAQTLPTSSYITAAYTLDSRYVNVTGDTMTGTINSVDIIPKADNTYTLGTLTNRWKEIFGYTFTAYTKFQTGSSYLDSNNDLYIARSVGIKVAPDINYALKVTDNSYFNGHLILADNKFIRRNGRSVSWIQGRDGAILRQTTYTGYNPIISAKTTDGDWSFGPYENNIMYLTYCTDANYNAGTNATTAQFFFRPNGAFQASYIGVNGDNTSYRLYVNGNSYLSGGTTVGYLTVEKQDSVNEGGEICLSASKTSMKKVYIDNHANQFRIHDGATERFKVNMTNGDVYIGNNKVLDSSMFSLSGTTLTITI